MKGRETRDQIAKIHWTMEKARKFQKNNYFSFIDYMKVFDCVDNNKLWEILKDMGIPDHLTCLLAENIEELKSLLMRVKEQREKAGLKLKNKNKTKTKQKTIIMASSPIT